MLEFRTLEEVSIDVLHKTFVEAFSDYQVKIDLPLWKFENMLARRGYAPEKSMGAFKGNALVGFILNGYRKWNGITTAYDQGTGVVPQYRKQGITTNLFLKLAEQLKSEGAGQYLLEVLQQNTSAFELYKKQGFEITRTFSCYKLENKNYQPKKEFAVEHVNSFTPSDWEHLKAFWDFQPSWQNSVDSVSAVQHSFIYAVVRLDNKIAGYGIIDKKTGDIPQLGVDKDYRRKGIAGSIMSDLINCTEADKAAVINVDDSSNSMKGFLEASGFEHYVDQYEMLLKLAD